MEDVYMGEGKGIGLVLAGGGGKGAYQVGVLKVLQEQGLLEDVTAISGASIGAVNAMLYSMNDMERMYQAWNEIDMDTVFDIDLNMLAEKRMYFSRNEMLAMFEKYIDMEKIKADFRDIYTICAPSSTTRSATFHAIDASFNAPKMIPRFPFNKLKDIVFFLILYNVYMLCLCC